MSDLYAVDVMNPPFGPCPKCGDSRGPYVCRCPIGPSPESLERGHAIIAGAKELCGPQWQDAPTEEGYWWLWRPRMESELMLVQRCNGHLLYAGILYRCRQSWDGNLGWKWHKADITPPQPPTP